MARNMKDSGIEWIGEIPEGWEIKRLGAILQERNEVNNPIQTTSILSLTNNRGVIPYSEKGNQGNKAKDDLTGYKIAHIGDIVLNSMNVIIGSVGLSNYYGAVSPVYYMLFPRNNIETNIQYYNYLFQTTAFQQSLRGYGNGILEIRMRIQMQKLKTVLLPVPTFLEQSNITVYLDASLSKLNILLSKIRSSIEEYKKLKQAVITQAVTKGVRGEQEMKDSGVEWIGEIPKEWVCEKIKYATSISRGLFNHRPRNDERYYNGKYPFIQTGDVANATKYIVSYSQTLNELGKSVSKEFPKGTLTMTIAANVGDVAILNFDAYFPDSIVGFIPNKNIRTLYLFYVFSAMKDEFTRTAIKSTQFNLNIDRVKETFIPVTLNVNEQCEIENYLESKCAEIDGLIAKKEQLVKELESYKKSLIYEVVTGKREIFTDITRKFPNI